MNIECVGERWSSMELGVYKRFPLIVYQYQRAGDFREYEDNMDNKILRQGRVSVQ